MLDEKRVILMTRLASYEQGEGKRNVAIAKYFRSDYVLKNVLKAFVCAVITFFVGLGMYLLYGYEEIMEQIYEIDLFAMMQDALWYFIYLVVIYCAVIFLVCVVQYYLARKSLKVYYQNLKKLNALYEEK